jgi:hypothetical protein
LLDDLFGLDRGMHFCLAANVGRTQLHAIYRQLQSRLPDIGPGGPDPLAGCFAYAVRSTPCTFTAQVTTGAALSAAL